MRARRLAAFVCFGLAGVLVLPGFASADQPIEVGWWYKLTSTGGSAAAPAGPAPAPPAGPAAPAPTLPPTPVPIPTIPTPTSLPDPPADVPPPATVPEGGIYVANDPTGAAATSALRFDASDVGDARLTLKIAPGSTTTTPFTMVACPPLSSWTAIANGAWRDRPAHDCARLSLSGSLAPDGTTITWNIPASFKPQGATTLDVLLLPLEGDGVPFSVVFEAPAADALTVLSPPPPPTTVPPTTLAPLPTSPSVVSSPSPATTSFFSPPTFPQSASTVRPSAPPATTAPEPASSVLDALKENRTARIVATLVLVAMGVAFYFASNKDARLPRLLGAVALSRAGATVAPELVQRARGIGRFARPRTAPATRL